MQGADKQQEEVPQGCEEYNEKDAVATIFSVKLGMTQTAARAVVDEILVSGTEEERRMMQRVCDKLRDPLMDLPNADRQREMRRLMWKLNTKARLRAWALAPFTAPPGSAMLGIASFLFSQHYIENRIKPLVADYQFQLAEARREGWHKALIVRIEYWWRFAQTTAALAKIIGKLIRWLIGLDD